MKNGRKFVPGDVVRFCDGSWAVHIVHKDGKIQLDNSPALAYQRENQHLRRWKVLKTDLILPLGYSDDNNVHAVDCPSCPSIDGLQNTILLAGLDTGTLAFTMASNLTLVNKVVKKEEKIMKKVKAKWLEPTPPAEVVAEYDSLDQLIKEHNFIGFQSPGCPWRYMVISYGCDIGGTAVRPQGRWADLDGQKHMKGEYYIFDTAAELLDWMKG